ncbi:MAG TPA: PEGA domain-containing protein [Polyangiaceae bacterium]|nr:PEGA domain-containing protein [Polyangiaceae bacterium]
MFSPSKHSSLVLLSAWSLCFSSAIPMAQAAPPAQAAPKTQSQPKAPAAPKVQAKAPAAPTVREELSADAQRDWDAARELYDARDYRGALVHFEKAYELSRNPRVLFNVGVCWKDLTRYAQAIRVWERQLEFGARLSLEDLERTKSAIAAARPFVSTLTLQSDQPGAVILIDGVEAGTTPVTEGLPVDVGRHTVTLKKDGFAPSEAAVDVIQGTPAALTLNMTPLVKLGTVAITVVGPRSATVFVDGRELGPAPFTGTVQEGPHTFEARAPGYLPARQTTEIRYAERSSLTLALAEARNEGKVRIVTDYPDAAIAVDGEVKGSGAWEGLLPAGGHQLRVQKSGFKTHVTELSLSAGQQRSLQVHLEKQQSWLWWTVGIATVVGGGTVAAILLSRPTDTSPVTGTLGTF